MFPEYTLAVKQENKDSERETERATDGHRSRMARDSDSDRERAISFADGAI
jgi:hypothetical protein